MEIALRGIGVSPGIAIGPAITFGVKSLEIPRYTVSDVDAELARFERALETVRIDLQRIFERTAEVLGPQHADIFKAHLMFLEDVSLREEIVRRAIDERTNVEFLLNELIARYKVVMESLDDPMFRERADVMVDVGNRVLRKLLDNDLESLEHLAAPSVVVAHDLSPSDTAKIDLQNALGIATDFSGPTSHTAILARAFEIPAVVGLKYVGSHTQPGDIVILDGRTGNVVIRPREETIVRFQEARERELRNREALLAIETQRSVTLDERELPILANIELPVELTTSIKARAQGIGLYRTEYLYLNRKTLPTEEEQYEAYAEVASRMAPAPVTIRTLDIGGDKFVSHLQISQETNPQLGWRAIRFCLERPDIFKAQLRAILRASVHGQVQIMFPLISGLDELLRAKTVVREVAADLERRGISFKKDVLIGTMIEVPSAVEIADDLAKETAFFSIGTNDLIQYALAVDRVNERVAHMYEPAHPAVLRLINRTIRAAHAAGIPCAVCGEMAGDPVFSEVLLGMGVSSLSMSAVAIPAVRAEIASLKFSDARRFTNRLLKTSSSKEARETLIRRFNQRHSDMEPLD